ncbi:ATP-binding protein [Anabaena azotica]|uniref:ATP-binding protein n=1 Tax=Anabaena azotica FACHB-119 TaxID=947527 RepID=A0ABR8DFA3_9NOST|nr:ATP-binding protein [Anabaena azotica]MBD2505331.1 ATP-binding protein [Anabaena azotica FACHB-119]
MEFLTNVHSEIERSQKSDLIDKFDKYPFDKKLVLIGLGLVGGVFCGANAWRGEISDRQFFCIQPPQGELQCYDKNNRHYRMTKWHWEQWGKEGRPRTVIAQDYVKASNPYKPYWAFGAFVSFAVSGWLLRHLQDTESKLSVFQEIQHKTAVAQAEMEAKLSLFDTHARLAIAEVELAADLELAANNRTVDIQRAEILGETEIEVTKLDAQDALFEAQTAGMSDEEKREYIEFIRQQKTPYLSGTQSIDSVANPKDKVEGEQQTQPLTGSTTANGNESDTSVVAQILGRVAREDGSTALCGDPGTGKSTITREYIRQVSINCPDADIRVLAVKNDSFCGLREAGRVTRFIGEGAVANAKEFFLAVRDVYRSRLEVESLEERKKLKPFIVILDDWLTISAKLNKIKPENLGFDFGEILFDILIIGREYNMKFFVNLHSLNLKAIGIKEMDQNTRKILRLLLLGNRYRQDGREIDAYGVIEQAIMGNQVITHEDDKTKVRSRYTQLKAESRQIFQPVMFAFVGEYYLGIVPKFVGEQIICFPPLNQQPVESVTEDELEPVDDVFAGILDNVPVVNNHLSPIAHAVVEIIRSGKKVPTSFETIRNSRYWTDGRWHGEKPSIGQIDDAIAQLIQCEIAAGNRDEGYILFNNA